MHSIKLCGGLAAAAAVTLALVGCATAQTPSAAPAHDPAAQPIVATDQPSTEVPQLLESTSPLSAEEFVATYGGLAVDGSGHDLAGVQAEYRAAAEAFPYPLPDGYGWPAESPVLKDDPNVPTMWQGGNGVVTATFYWTGATAHAAILAAERADWETSDALLDRLVTASQDGVQGMYIEDGAGGTRWLNADVLPAYEGDWSGLIAMDIDPFVSVPEYVAIAATAGDRYPTFGTEGIALPIRSESP